ALARVTGYARPRTTRCAPEGVYVSALGTPDGGGPGGLFVLDPETFEVRGRWEIDRGPQRLAGDFGWHLGHDTLVTAEWGGPEIAERGLVAETLLAGGYGHQLHVWDRRRRAHVDALDLGRDQQMVLAVQPAHDPTRAYGFAGVALSAKDLSASVWMWHRAGEGATTRWAATKIIQIAAEPAPPDALPEWLRPFGAVPPLVTGLNLSLDDRFLYVSCWGTGELRQYDVADPFEPRLAGSVRLGGILRHAPHPARPADPLNGGPQTIEVSRDGRRLYVTNSLYLALDEQFYPDGLRGWMARVNVMPGGGLQIDGRCFLQFDDWRPHAVHLDGGDTSSDSYCYA
ncbi:MAG: selenium-binding family protein, partial [Acidobacteriota bacterium]|nr:selenium-binding family protein [Acidobacteriota bacterium]